MKITDLRVYITRPEGSLNSWLFVEIDTDEGITGVGEATNAGGGGALVVGRAYEMLRDDLEGYDFSEGLLGVDPANIDAIWHRIYRRFGTLGSRGFGTTVASGIDTALWDIKGKALGRPVWDLLGGKIRNSVPVYTGVGSLNDIDACVADAKRLVSLGYRALGLDPFDPEMRRHHRRFVDGKISAAGAAYAENLMSALREAVGPDIELMIDAHGNFDVSTATEMCNRMSKFNLTWFEEPLQPESLDAHRQLRRNTDVNLCIGERKYTRWDFAPYLQEGLVNYIKPDVCWTGGISEMKRIAVLAETYYVPITPHDASGAFNLIAGAHLLMNVPNIYRLEMSESVLENYNAVITEPLDVRDGHLHLPDRAGLGYELNHDYIATHPDPEWARLHA
ncbi:MAG: mandelate racemase/muconate lactonizing enzyme family protein [Dehalococcoidia bacterium]|jgi:galactonate dehydratase|nr:mandelate racemase/muconate lactonizing enzyme family protein [Dehalococcoidia bacterium]